MVGNDDAGTLDEPTLDAGAAADSGEKERRAVMAEPTAP
jgi:hypothetical protein